MIFFKKAINLMFNDFENGIILRFDFSDYHDSISYWQYRIPNSIIVLNHLVKGMDR